MKREKLRFILLITSVVLATFSAVGIYFFCLSFNEIRNMNDRALKDRLTTVADDLDRQYTELNIIAVSLQSNRIYNRAHVLENAYNEIELLSDLVRYKTVSQITEDYFFMYHDNGDVFKSTGAKNKYNIFLLYYGIKDETLFDELTSIKAFKLIPVNTTYGKKILMAFPVFTAWSNDLSARATIAFFISDSSVAKRMKALTGGCSGKLYIYLNGAPFASLDGDEFPTDISLDSETVTRLGKMTRYTISNGRFTVVCDAMPNDMITDLQKFSTSNIIYLIVVLCVMLTAAVLAALRGYRPIGQLVEKYITPDSKEMQSNELLAIEKILDNALRGKEDAEHSLQSSYELIKRRTLRLILSGDAGSGTFDERPFFGIRLQGPYYALLVLRGEAPLSKETQKQLSFIDDELNGVYFSDTKYANTYVFLVNLEHRSELDKLYSSVLELCGEICGYSLYSSQVFDDILLFPDYLSTVISDGNGQAEMKPIMFDDSNVNVVGLLEAVNDGNTRTALYYFSTFMNEFHESCGSFLLEKYIAYNLLNRLRDSSPKNLITTQRLSRVLAAATWQELYTEFEHVVIEFCGGDYNEDIDNDPQNPHAERILAFIDANFTDTELTLETLADEFDLSKKYISGIIKGHTGLPYKDYLTRIRLSEARRLLKTENITVTEVCERCGYLHLPYFIKLFKRETGMTPAAYRDHKV